MALPAALPDNIIQLPGRGGNAPVSVAEPGAPSRDDYRFKPVTKLRQWFQDYVGAKTDETMEQRKARLYYHGSQWSESDLRELRARKQPPTTTSIFARKINGFVGLVERLRQDPKAFPRKPQDGDGAELVTDALRYAMDAENWQGQSPFASQNGAIDGLGGIAIGLTERGGAGDFDVTIEVVDPETFFYDPQSMKHDFSDARYMGVSKWVDLDDAIDMFPDYAEDLKAVCSQGSTGDSDVLDSEREIKWANSRRLQLRMVEHWYRIGAKWAYAFYTGDLLLEEAPSYLHDDNGKDMCRFIMWSAFVDQAGDRYGFWRNMRSDIDQINQLHSKIMHQINMRRIIMDEGAVDDIAQLRREAVRADGVIVKNPGFELIFDDQRMLADIQALSGMLMQFQAGLENFGPNPALVGQGVQAKSGRAIALLQQAGLAELGPYIINWRDWKIRCYRLIWWTIREHWTAERWIRVTGENGDPQPVQINAVQMTPFGPQPINHIGQVDVDVIIDEGPDAVTMAADALETLQEAIRAGVQVPPALLIKCLPLSSSMQKEMIGAMEQASQPSPQQQQAAQLQLAELQGKVQLMEAQFAKLQADAQLSMAKAHQAMQPEQQEAGPAGPTMAEQAEQFGRARQAHADADLKQAQAQKIANDAGNQDAKSILAMAQAHKASVEAELAPAKLQADQEAQSERLNVMREGQAARNMRVGGTTD